MKKTILLFFAIIAFTVNDTFAQQPDENKPSGLVFTENGEETHGSSKYIEEENQVHMEEVLQEEETGIRMIILEILATSLLI